MDYCFVAFSMGIEPIEKVRNSSHRLNRGGRLLAGKALKFISSQVLRASILPLRCFAELLGGSRQCFLDIFDGIYIGLRKPIRIYEMPLYCIVLIHDHSHKL